MLGNWLEQIGSVTVMNLRNMRERASSTIVALFGVTGVVTVVIGVLSINEGFVRSCNAPAPKTSPSSCAAVRRTR